MIKCRQRGWGREGWERRGELNSYREQETDRRNEPEIRLASLSDLHRARTQSSWGQALSPPRSWAGLEHARVYQLNALIHSPKLDLSTHLGSWVSKWKDFPGGSMVKNLPANAGDTGLIPGLGRFPRGGNGNRSSILTRVIPWTEEPGGLQFMGSQRVEHD